MGKLIVQSLAVLAPLPFTPQKRAEVLTAFNRSNPKETPPTSKTAELLGIHAGYLLSVEVLNRVAVA